MTASQGDVWWGPAPHKSGPTYRPWLVISDTSHPFANNECIAVGLTTQHYPKGIAVPDSAWVRGGSETKAYISPWYVTTIKQRGFDNQQGTLSDSLVAETIDALHSYTSLVDDL